MVPQICGEAPQQLPRCDIALGPALTLVKVQRRRAEHPWEGRAARGGGERKTLERRDEDESRHRREKEGFVSRKEVIQIAPQRRLQPRPT